jgi:O-antigen ligase
VTSVLGGGVAAGVFGITLALPGITSDGRSRGTRVHDGWIFLLVLLAGAALVALVAFALLRVRVTPEHRRAVERVAAGLALACVLGGLAVAVVKGGSIWHEFTNPAASQTVNNPTHLTQGGSGNRWSWWQEAWHGFTSHPLGGTGAGTWHLTDLRLRKTSDVTALEPHNTPLQFLSETGIVGFLLYAGIAGAALAAAWRRRGGATTALGLCVAAFLAHTVVNYDWSFVSVCGPFLLVGGVLVARPAEARSRRPLLAAAAVAFALACVYSLAAPWLADRAYASADTAADLKRAHGYNPLSTQILTEWGAFEGGNQGLQRFRDAVALEPTNPNVWYDLASYYAGSGSWVNAYRALSKAFTYDPYGPAGQCGLAAQIRRKVGIKVSSCRGAGSP